MDIKNKKKRKAKELKNQEEIDRILMKVNEIKNETLFINESGVLNNDKDFILNTKFKFETPNDRYKFYYSKINKILKKYLPKGIEYKKFRELIYEEKNTFLTRGKRKNTFGIRGADGRMANLRELKSFFNLLYKSYSSNSSMYEFYIKLKNLNKQLFKV